MIENSETPRENPSLEHAIQVRRICMKGNSLIHPFNPKRRNGEVLRSGNQSFGKRPKKQMYIHALTKQRAIQRQNNPDAIFAHLLVGARDGHETLTGLHVCACISLGILREGTIGSPQINKWLHRFQLMRLQHLNLGSSQDEVAETAVHLSLKAEVVERINEVSPVQMRVDSEHLTEDCLAYVKEVDRETTALANPITRARELGERSIQAGWASRNWVLRARSVQTTRSVGCRCNIGGTGIVCEGDTNGIGWEDSGVVNLARDPSLHQGDILVCWNFDWLSAGVQPSEGVIAVHVRDRSILIWNKITYAPADIRGQVWTLQIVVPSSSLS